MSAPRRNRDARRRALGQNFLVDDGAIAAVVGSLHPPPPALVVDLGAGAGALTAPLARRGARVLAVEIDPTWARTLRANAPRWGDVEVRQADALTVPLPAEPFRVISAAPYGIGTRLVRRLLSTAHGMTSAVVVLQVEAARRLAGRPACSRFAATWAPWFQLRVGARIDRSAFRPVPAVDSAVLEIRPRRRPLLSPAAFAEYDAFLSALFRGRDATVLARLARNAGRHRARAALRAAAIPPSSVPSRLRPEQYASLYTAAALTGRRAA